MPLLLALFSCKVLTSKIQIFNPKITTCPFITWNWLVNLQIAPQPLISHFVLLRSQQNLYPAIKAWMLNTSTGLLSRLWTCKTPSEDGVAKDVVFCRQSEPQWAQGCSGELVASLLLLKACWRVFTPGDPDFPLRRERARYWSHWEALM